MIVAGFGIRATASLPTLRALLGNVAVDALAVVADKADHPALNALAAQIRRPLLRVALADLATDRAQTPAPQQPDRYGPTSVAEAAALAAAGPYSILIRPRIIAPDGSATMAIAEGKTP
ncbi:precorrin methylase [Pseudorhodobacter sp. E13]|uniref:cobalamin biosynthesis protein n=1 Tax=Pseudorhodobacter sp. E13 TaxID=2487931 RepID=UPI000F8C5652|nr:cobalamin biosynthesis protein [Pseudorhodobacter sp. E13]RUS63312.1 precorrin methylase [Pseudorhodobacter sp. E13]